MQQQWLSKFCEGISGEGTYMWPGIVMEEQQF
jgi:hypothetical protein